MNLKQYLASMCVGTGMCIAALIFVLINIDPFEAGAISFFFFYASMFLSMIGISSIALFFIHRIMARGAVPLFRLVEKSFREGLVISCVLIVLLYLQGNQWLSSVTFSLLIVLVMLSVISAMVLHTSTEKER